MRWLLFLVSGLMFTGLLLSGYGCKEAGDIPNTIDSTYLFSQETGLNGWTAGFSNFPAGDTTRFGILVRLDTIPLNNRRVALRFSTRNNVNPDANPIYCYLKKSFTGLQPDTRYQVSVGLLDLFTNAPDTTRTRYQLTVFARNPNTTDVRYRPRLVDTTQGRRIVTFASISSAEPVAQITPSGIRQLSNFDPQGITNTVNGNLDSVKRYRAITSRKSFSATTDANGVLWVVVGTQSRYKTIDRNNPTTPIEYPTTFYLSQVNVRLQPF